MRSAVTANPESAGGSAAGAAGVPADANGMGSLDFYVLGFKLNLELTVSALLRRDYSVAQYSKAQPWGCRMRLDECQHKIL